MSVMMIALRIAAVQALKAGNTLVGDNVLDSQISAIDQTSDGQLRIDQTKPFIAVYTDMAKAQSLGQTGLRANGEVELTFNCGVSITMAETNKSTGASQIVDLFPATDANLEAVLDGLDVQISRVLVDPDNPWSQVFGGLVRSYVAKSHFRSSSSAANVRLAAGQTKIVVEAFADPSFGDPLVEGGPMHRFMTLMQQSGHPQFGFMEQLIGGGQSGLYPNFEALTGMTTQDAQSLRLYAHGDVTCDVVITDADSAAGGD